MIKLDQEVILFDWRTYYNTYKDIIIKDLEIDVKNRDVAWYHWKNFGKKSNLQFFKIDKDAVSGLIKTTDTDPEYATFDWKQYVKNYSDLEKTINTKKLAWNHWIKYGKKEGRTWILQNNVDEPNDEYNDFDWRSYVNNYPDLSHFKNKSEAWKHWINHGKMEGRKCNAVKKYETNATINTTEHPYFEEVSQDHWNSFEERIYKEFCDFDWMAYIENYEDLRDITNKFEAWEHWFFQGRLEGRIYINFNGIDDKYYKTILIEDQCYPERKLVIKEKLSMKTWVDHIYVTNFEFLPSEIENEDSKDDYVTIREIKNSTKNFSNNSIKRHKNILKMSIFVKHLYKNKINKFMNIYNISNSNIIVNEPKVEYRYFCFKYLDFMRNCFIIPELELFNKYEAVFIEFREFDHVEFIIRNAIMQLGPNWSYTVVCGNDNYNFMITLCNNICKNIKIIKTTFNAVTINEYSDFLKTSDFWNLLIGEKILIYQEDSFIFNDNIREFLDYDYIGAPWLENVLPIRVGNGGLSLRTRQIMLDIIETISNDNDKNLLHEIISEDVFFSKHMQRLGMGKISDEETATRFSSELIYNKNSFGGHQFWLSDPCWKSRIYDSMHNLMLNKTSAKIEFTESANAQS